ncbi:cAMP-regulated phosphoprotein 21 isoform X2 [Gouania willdenowi]|uniref:cAMP-regulated phosphoprotein 21 isoform X2 n=1 Tax=Gouania willdenowi TaxID=441366 RepID=UPI0010560ABB|nr:cAMP-regulated phosphoprotein 21 isoform X2 [Gouania willdenowi]
MSETAVESADILVKPCSVMSCDALHCPSPPPCQQQLCIQREDEDGERQSDAKKVDQQKRSDQVQPKKKVKAKGKLVRSMAVCEETDPLEERQESSDVSSKSQDAEMNPCEECEPENNADTKKPTLSKESSVEYTDSTGIDLHQFIVDTLNSNPRDRMMLLKLEQDVIDFITSNSSFKKFPHMSSYHRMLVHRVAAYFGMEHNVDQTGKSVIINRTSSTRIPDQRFPDLVHKDRTDEIQQWKSILKRDNSSDDQSRLHPLREKQSKSMEEREEEYQRARERIFRKEPPCSQECVVADTREVEEYNPYAETQRRRQLFRGSRDGSGSSWTGSSRQSSTETDCRFGSDPRPWSSTDSDSSYQWTSPAPKARQPSCHNWDARGSGSISLFRLPPHPSPPPIIEELPPNSAYMVENGIPPGSILVNPQTGQPFLNPDGTPAVYNPPDIQQPIRSQTQLQGPPTQPQQVLQYSSVSYTPQMLPVTPSQPYSTIEDLSSQFSHVTVSCQSTGETPPLYPANQGYIYAAPPPPLPPPNPSTYCQPSPQVPVYYYGQYPTSAQHGCRPVSPTQQHPHSRAAPPAGSYAPAVRGPQSSHSQGVLGTYSPVASHQCSMIQGTVPVTFPQSKVMGGEAGYCCVVPPPPVHGGCHPQSCTNLGAPAWSAQY